MQTGYRPSSAEGSCETTYSIDTLPSSNQVAKEEEDSQVKEGAVKQVICGSG